jgi:WG containing repeat
MGNLAIVQANGRWGLVDTTGRIVAKTQYESILPFQENRAVFKRNNRLGFLDPTGREVIPADYIKVSQFTNGQASALRWGLFITLDSAGHWVDVRLQTSTLKTLLWVFGGLIVLMGLYVRKYQSVMRDESI